MAGKVRLKCEIKELEGILTGMKIDSEKVIPQKMFNGSFEQKMEGKTWLEDVCITYDLIENKLLVTGSYNGKLGGHKHLISCTKYFRYEEFLP